MGKLRRERDNLGRFVKGNAAALRHGGFSSNSKDIPLAIRRQVQIIREHLVRDIAGSEQALTASQAILIDKAVNLYQITLCLEAYVRANGPFKGKKLDPVLGQNYLAFINSLRLTLRELGVSKKAQDDVLDITTFVRDGNEKGTKDAETNQDKESEIEGKDGES